MILYKQMGIRELNKFFNLESLIYDIFEIEKGKYINLDRVISLLTDIYSDALKQQFKFKQEINKIIISVYTDFLTLKKLSKIYELETPLSKLYHILSVIKDRQLIYAIQEISDNAETALYSIGYLEYVYNNYHSRILQIDYYELTNELCDIFDTDTLYNLFLEINSMLFGYDEEVVQMFENNFSPLKLFGRYMKNITKKGYNR